MKQIIAVILILATCFYAKSQTDLKKTTETRPAKKTAASTESKPATLQPQGDRLIPDPKLPDLKMVSLAVTYINSQVIDGKTKHSIEVNFTLKNDGTVAVDKYLFGVQGWIGYDAAFPKTIAACGIALSHYAGNMLNPGETYTNSFRCTAAFNKNSPIIYTLYTDEDNRIKELTEGNNSAQLTIQL
jgi:CARDB